MNEIVSVEPAPRDAEPLLRDLLELYVEELSSMFRVRRGDDGRFGYPRLSLYWSEPAARFPFLIKTGADVAGFVLVTRGSPATDNPADLDVAEFFVRRQYRRAGVGGRAAAALWDRLRGQWVVRVSEANAAGLHFWPGVIASYTGGRFVERMQPGNSHRWRVFSFASRGH